MVGIIGRSGAGKSTLLRMINRLQEPTSGSIHFGGQEVSALRGEALAQARREKFFNAGVQSIAPGQKMEPRW